MGQPDPKRPVRGRPPKNARAPRGPEEVVDAVAIAAVHLFGERGIAPVTVRQVALAADVNPGLVHRYVGTKEDVVRLALSRATSDLAVALAGITDPFDAEAGSELDVLDAYERLVTHVALEGLDPELIAPDPLLADQLVARVTQDSGLCDREARLRVASILALDIGWRLFAPLVSTSTHLRPDEHAQVDRAVRTGRDELLARP